MDVSHASRSSSAFELQMFIPQTSTLATYYLQAASQNELAMPLPDTGSPASALWDQQYPSDLWMHSVGPGYLNEHDICKSYWDTGRAIWVFFLTHDISDTQISNLQSLPIPPLLQWLPYLPTWMQRLRRHRMGQQPKIRHQYLYWLESWERR